MRPNDAKVSAVVIRNLVRMRVHTITLRQTIQYNIMVSNSTKELSLMLTGVSPGRLQH